MGSHVYHDVLPGYSPEQIWFDGCPECLERSRVIWRGIGTLDYNNFARAWARAIEWNTNGLANISHVEVPLLETLWAVHCQQNTAQYLQTVQLADISSWEDDA